MTAPAHTATGVVDVTRPASAPEPSASASAMTVALSLRGVSKTYVAKEGPVLRGVDLDVGSGELVSLLGPSGCGKSTLLRLVAGFLEPDSGSIELGGRDITKVPTHKRDVAIVHQSHALWPHLTVAENVAFGLEMRRVPRRERERRVAQMLEVVGLGDLGRRLPPELSGGQQQRVALARALVVNPRILLLDEPLSSLDANLRVHLREEIRRIQREMHVTTLLVTHDREEAMAVSDRIVVLERGEVAQVGNAEDIYLRPRSPFVMGFTGACVRFDATVEAVERDCITVAGPLGVFTFDAPDGSSAVGDAIVLGVRPEDLTIRPRDLRAEPAVHRPGTEAVIEDAAFLGTTIEVRVRAADGARIDVRLAPDDELPPLGSAVWIAADPRRVHAFPR
jgi:putative spermidine/putrescine transport system ATP-binding protein